MYNDNYNFSENPLSKFIYFIFFSFLLWSCKSTNGLEKQTISPETPYFIEDELNFEEVEEPYRYVFFRLYNPSYTNPLYVANLLKIGIRITEVTDMNASHASINFSLEDNFWGLTLNDNQQLAQESCTDITTNEYMQKCNPDLSEQTTYAMRVSKEEFENLKNSLEEYTSSNEVRYETLRNFKMTAFQIRRKFFTSKEKQLFGNLEYKNDCEKDRLEFDPQYTENNFVCSTFVAYLLNKNVAHVNQYFNEHNINYRYVNVTDLPSIPGMTKLFFSNWTNYTQAAQVFVNQNEEFNEYLN